MKCFIYRNLTRRGFPFSIKALEGEYKGKVIGYAFVLSVENVTFSVNAKGRDKVREAKRKTVHAGVVGTVTGCRFYTPRLGDPIVECELESNTGALIKYNPYINDTFINAETGNPVATASRVYMEDGKVFAYGLGI